MATQVSLRSNYIKKYSLRLLVLTWMVMLGTSPAAAQNHHWSQRFGGISEDEGLSVSADASGNVFVTGFFRGTVDFGGGPLTSAGSKDIFLAKYDDRGTHLWSQRFGNFLDDEGFSVSVDASGNVFVTGAFAGSVDFGGGPLIGALGGDIFLAKYDASGTHLWSQRFGSTNSDKGFSVSVNASGDVFVTGVFFGTVDFGGGLLSSAGGGRDIFLAKYDASGTHLWSQRFGNIGDDWGFSVSVDASGDVFVTGSFESVVNFGGGPLNSSGSKDIFLAKYGASGAHLWSQRFGSTLDDEGLSLSVNASGTVFVTGSFQGTADFGGGQLTSAGAQDIFLAKYDANGAHLWSQRFGSTLDDEGLSLSVNASGTVFVTGSFQGTADFGGGQLTSAGSKDIFLVEHDASGTHLRSQRFGSTGFDLGQSVSIDASGNVFVTGAFQDTVDFGGGPLAIAGFDDIFLAKYGPLSGSITSIVDVGNDQGRWVRITFSGSARDVPGSPTPVIRYDAYRRIDPLPFSLTEGSHSTEKPKQSGWPYEDSKSIYLIDGWDFAGSVPASTDRTYNMIAPTLADSTLADGQHWSVFFVRAATADPGTFFDTAPDSGYSLATVVTGVPDTPRAKTLNLSANPNPFNPTTMITYTVPSAGSVTLAIYDIQGRIVETLVDNGHREQGDYRIAYELPGATGVYFVRLVAGDETQTLKIVVLK